MDSKFLTELLSGKHFNMIERAERGAWPHPLLHYRDLVEHLVDVLDNQAYFPKPWVPHKEGMPFGDRTVIVRESPSRYVVHYERSGPAMNLAETGERIFILARDAVDFGMPPGVGPS